MTRRSVSTTFIDSEAIRPATQTLEAPHLPSRPSTCSLSRPLNPSLPDSWSLCLRLRSRPGRSESVTGRAGLQRQRHRPTNSRRSPSVDSFKLDPPRSAPVPPPLVPCSRPCPAGCLLPDAAERRFNHHIRHGFLRSRRARTPAAHLDSRRPGGRLAPRCARDPFRLRLAPPFRDPSPSGLAEARQGAWPRGGAAAARASRLGPKGAPRREISRKIRNLQGDSKSPGRFEISGEIRNLRGDSPWTSQAARLRRTARRSPSSCRPVAAGDSPADRHHGGKPQASPSESRVLWSGPSLGGESRPAAPTCQCIGVAS